MIPLRDNAPTASFPYVTITLILMNTLVYFFQPEYLKPFYELIPQNIATGHVASGVLYHSFDGVQRFVPMPLDQLARLDPNSHSIIPVYPTITPWETIFTAMFMHANLLHLAGNMLFLWIFGNNVEDAFGKLRFLLFYLFCGVAAALLQVAVSPHSLVPNLGASGAIAGVMGAYIVMYPSAKVTTLFWLGIIIFWREISAFWVIGIWIALQVVEGVSGLGGEATGGVAYFAHIGGFVAGVVVTILVGGRALGARASRAARFSRV